MRHFVILLLCASLLYLINGNKVDKDTSNCGNALTNFIRCYQNVSVVINFPTDEEFLEMVFTAYKRNFHAILHHTDDPSIYPEIQVNVVNKERDTFKYNPRSHYWSGYLEDELSQVHGHIKEGLFTGVIHSINETYYVEPCRNYLEECDPTISLIYRVQDVEFWTRTNASWGSKSVVNNAKIVSNKRKTWPKTLFDVRNYRTTPFSVKRRASILSNTSSICEIHAVVDHTFYRIIGESKVSQTISDILYHITEASAIFRETDFNGDTLGDNIVFAIKEITIYETQQAAQYLMASTRLSVDDYLDIFSTFNFDDACLGVSFTHRDFDGGVIGMAWMASTYSPGGMCQKRVYYKDKGFYNGYFNFNTLLISTLNYGNRIPKQVSALTLTHEFGHSFGAKHDEPDDNICAPGGLYGHFLMHPHSSTANKPNNRLFSPCSLSSIAKIVRTKGYCMKMKTGGICGNGFPEVGEQCDCGYAPTCSIMDPCCTPASDASGCTFDHTQNKYCSPKVQGCCQSDCQVASGGVECSPTTACSLQSVCDGLSAECPVPEQMPDGTSCRNGEGVCQTGACVSIACQQNGFVDCQCEEPRHAQCKVCCSCSNITEGIISGHPACVPADWLGIFSRSGAVLYREDGDPCDNYRGTCGGGRICSSVYQDFTAYTTENFNNQAGIGTQIWTWVVENYMYIIIGILSLVISFVAFLRVFGSASKGDDLILVANASDSLDFQTPETTGLESELEDVIFEKARAVWSKMGEPQNSTSGVARMCSFFPTAPKSLVISTLINSTSEQIALKTMLLWGYPINKLVLDEGVIVEQKTEDTDIKGNSSTVTLDSYIGRVHSEISSQDLSSFDACINTDSKHSSTDI